MDGKLTTGSPNKFLKRTLPLLIAIVFIVSIVAVFVSLWAGNVFYPRKYQSEVEAAAARFGLEPNLIYAIIKTESNFAETAVSSAGAIGLMQIVPDTFLFDIRQNVGLDDASSSALFEAETNILAGAYYFAYWYDYFCDVYEMKDPMVETLAVYNAGIGNVWKWLEDDSLSDWNGLFVDKIPFDETREYVKRVLAYKEKYDDVYGKAVMENGYVSENLCYRWAKRYGEEYGLDPRYVMAVVHAESSFNPNDLSRSGAAGLMQITKVAYTDIKADLNLEEEYEDLFDPEFNVKCGTYYLHWTDERVDGIIQISAAYNMGLTTVQEWLADPRYSADGETLILENIPNDSTRRYITNILNYYEEYCARYPYEP